MIKANFALNDLRRRKMQTSITITTLTLSVASTLFLLLFTDRLGLDETSVSGTLTLGLTAIFSQFTLFVGVLIFIIGAVLTSFVAFLMMAQRTRDFGLIKAVGCPNSLVGGYLMTELLTTTLIGCLLGIGFGFLIDYGVSSIVFSGNEPPNSWFAPLVFVPFFVLAFFFGLQPILKAARMSPIQALSPVHYYGLTTNTSRHKALSHSALTWRVASRSLFRRQSASIRIIFLLTIVFILLTVSVGGGIIASGTTTSWVQKTVDLDTVTIAHASMGIQYKLLLSKFSGAAEIGNFDYSDPRMAIQNGVVKQLNALPSVNLVDSRLVLMKQVGEVSNFTVLPDTGQTMSVGDSRQGNAIVIGINPENLVGSWFVQGRFLGANDNLDAVVGDSIAHTLYSADSRKNIVLSDPLLESIEFQNNTFDIVGVCVDPLNNGLVTYVPIEKLMNITGIYNPNLLMVKLNPYIDRSAAITQIQTAIQAIDSDLTVLDLNDVVTKNTNFLASTWQTIMLLPLFTLTSAALCLVGYMMLAIDEQHQELAVLRAVGAKPKVVISILAIQSILVLLSSFAAGIPIGTIITLIILMQHPIATSFAVLQISGWLLAALIGMFLLSLFPALRLAKTSILKIMT
jgi:ABC-type antimicrobial peptide transport system permease subunit